MASNVLRKSITSDIDGVNKQFVDDVIFIHEKWPNNDVLDGLVSLLRLFLIR